MSNYDIADLKRQFKEQADWGFVSQYGRTGRIQSVDVEEKTVQVNTPRGLLHARVGEGTDIRKAKYNEEETLTFEDLTIGMLITVNGPIGTEGDTEASEIQVIPEGEDGFRIEPATGPGPHTVPLFP